MITPQEACEFNSAKDWLPDRIHGLDDFTAPTLDPIYRMTAEAFLAYDYSAGNGWATIFWGPLLDKAYPCLEPYPISEKIVFFCMRAAKVRSMPQNKPHLLDMIEFFAGSGQMALQHLIIGCHVAAFDNKYKSSLTHDCLSPIGLGLWGDALTATHPGAVTWFGTKCSPYLNICFANHKRSARNEYFGDQSISWVVKSNEVQATTALLYFLSTLLNNNPMLLIRPLLYARI